MSRKGLALPVALLYLLVNCGFLDALRVWLPPPVQAVLPTVHNAVAAVSPPICLDVDGDGQVIVDTDIVYIVRSLFGLTPLVPPSYRALDPTIPPDSTIAATINAVQSTLDVDGDGQVIVDTDIVYIVRSLFGLTPLVPPSYRALDPTIPPDSAIAAIIDALCNKSFTVVAQPSAADVIRGQSVSYAVTLNSTSGFSQLAALSVLGLPAGITASFTPQQITAGQTALLTLAAPSTQPLATKTFTVSAAAGTETRSVSLTLTVQPITTSFMGRTVIADTLETPLGGVTITFLGKDDNGNATGCTGQTVSDAAGNFRITNLPAACTGNQLVRYEGQTVTSAPGDYARVDLVYNFTAGQVTTSPVLVHLPRIDDKETVLIQQNAPTDQTFQFSTIPGLSITVYAGTTLTRLDGTRPDPFPLTGIQVDVDRLADAKPFEPQKMRVFIVAFQPANADASQPVAVSYPNPLNTPPGTNMVLMTLDPTKGKMVMYGTGTVSNDGTQIIPDMDPAHSGHRFGLVHFDWHGPMPPPPPDTNPGPPGGGGGGPPDDTPDDKGGFAGGGGEPDDDTPPGGGGFCPLPKGGKPGDPPGEGDPIDIASGLHVIRSTDMALNSPRGRIFIQRVYRTLSSVPGPFGISTSHNYAYRLDTSTPSSSAIINLLMPDGNHFPFVTGIAAGLVNTTIPALRGAKMTVLSGNKVDLRWKNGTVFHFIPAGTLGSLLDSISDPNGNVISLVRSGARITQIVDPVGRKLLLTYDGTNRITAITDPLNRTVNYTYNAQGLLQDVTDPEVGVTHYDYDAQNRLSKVTDAKHAVVAQNTYDANGRVSQQVQADGGIWKFAYTPFNPLAPMSPVVKTVVTNPLNQQTTYRFNPQGFLTDITDALGQTRIFEREPGTNLLLSLKGPAACSSCGGSAAGDESFTYDTNGSLLTRTDALGKTTTLTYEPVFNRVASIANPNPTVNGTTNFTYDSRGNLTLITDAKGNQTSFTYNAFGLVTKITDPLLKSTNISYDSFGNPVTITDPLNHMTTLRYDAASRLVEITNRLGRKSKTEYDALDRIKKITDAKNAATNFLYDEVGNLKTLIDAKGHTTSFIYDGMNRLTTHTDPLLQADTRMYDKNGNLKTFVDRRGQTATFTYDVLDRLTREAYQDGTVDRLYDAHSRLLRVNESNGDVFTFSYNLAGHVLNSTSPTGTVQYEPDDLGRVKKRQVVGQSPVTYSYDTVGNLTAATAPEASATFAYDTRNLLKTLTRSNSVSTTYNYDDLGQVLSIVHSKGATVLNSQTYTYDAEGNRSAYTTSSAQSFTTQAVSNVMYDTANRLTQRGSTTYIHDKNGNRTSETGPGGTTTYNWDSRDRLQSIVLPNGQTSTFRYDFAGNLIAKQTTGTGGGTENYLLDDVTNVVFQSNSSGQQFSILTGQSIDSHLATVQPGGQVRFGLDDALNSTVATADQNGAVNGQFFYEPFGETTASGSSYPFQYTGRVPVSGGLYHYRARFYDPRVGRFVSEDPIGFAAGDINLYRYVGNNSVNFIDPTGQWLKDIFELGHLGHIAHSLGEPLCEFGKHFPDFFGDLEKTKKALREYAAGTLKSMLPPGIPGKPQSSTPQSQRRTPQRQNRTRDRSREIPYYGPRGP